MKTQIVSISPDDEQEFAHAAKLLAQGEIVAFPTETIYGLGANALNEEAVKKIFSIKGRPADNPLIVHIHDLKQLQDICVTIPEHAKRLAQEFWPGALTLVLDASSNIGKTVTGGLSTVAVRMPAHPISLALLEQTGFPLAAPSANSSGRPSPVSAQQVYADLKDKLPLILDGGTSSIGIESTVVDCTQEIVSILRPGAITKEDLEQHVQVKDVEMTDVTVKSPGMKYKHYTPDVPLVLVHGDFEDKISRDIAEQGVKSAHILTYTEASLGTTYETIAQRLFSAFRDHPPCEIMYIPALDKEGLGIALMDRIEKASSRVI